MKDINLFLIYDQRSANRKLVYTVVALMAVSVIGLPAAYRFLLNADASALNSQTQVINEWLNSSQVRQTLVEFELKSARIDKLTEYKDSVRSTIDIIENIGSLSTDDLKAISDALPQQITVRSIEYADRNMKMVLLLPNREVAAETIYLLKQAKSVEAVMFDLVNYIDPDATDTEEEHYEMTVACRMKGGVLK